MYYAEYLEMESDIVRDYLELSNILYITIMVRKLY